MFLELLGHADAVVADGEMNPDEVLSPVRGLLVHGYVNPPAVGGELHGVAQNIQQNLIEPHAVAAHIFRGNVMNGHIEMLALCPDLGLDDADDAVQHLPQGDLVHAEGQLSALDLGHVQHVVDKPQQMPAGEGDLFQAVLHLLAVVDVGRGDGRHAHDGVHGRADVVGHVGEEFALGLVGPDGLLPRLVQLLHLLPGHLEVFQEYQHQHQQHQRAGAEHQIGPPDCEAVDDGVQLIVGHKGQQKPLGVRQLVAVYLPGLAVDPDLVGVGLPLGHGVGQGFDVQLRGLAVHGVVLAEDPLKIALPEGVPGADDKAAVLADDEGIDVVAVLLQGQGVADIGGREPRHQGGAGVFLRGSVGGGDPQEDHPVALGVAADGDLVLPGGDGGHEGPRVRQLQLRAVQHFKGPVRAVIGQMGKIPGLGVGNQVLLLLLAGMGRLGQAGLHHGHQLIQPQADGGLKVHGDLVPHAGHIQLADLPDGAGTLMTHKKRQKRKGRQAEGQHQNQAGFQKLCRLDFRFPAHDAGPPSYRVHRRGFTRRRTPEKPGWLP